VTIFLKFRSTLEEAEKSQTEPQKTKTVSNFAEVVGLIGAGIKMFEIPGMSNEPHVYENAWMLRGHLK
jgi:hypothetical protein